MTNSSNNIVNAKIAPEMTPGMMSDKVIFRKVVTPPALKFAEACSRSRSSRLPDALS